MPTSTYGKKIILLLVALFAITLFFLLPRNSAWLNKQLVQYSIDFRGEKNKLDEVDRLSRRFGNYFTYSKNIATAIRERTGNKPVLLLFPSSNYFKQRGVDYRVPEPAVFYYFTGLHSVWPNNSNAEQANWYVRAEAGSIIIDSVSDKKQFADTLAFFRKYDFPL